MTYQINFKSLKTVSSTLHYKLVKNVAAAEVTENLLMLTTIGGLTRNYPLINIESFAQVEEENELEANP